MVYSCPTCLTKLTRNPRAEERGGRSVFSLRLYKYCTRCNKLFKAYDE